VLKVSAALVPLLVLGYVSVRLFYQFPDLQWLCVSLVAVSLAMIILGNGVTDVVFRWLRWSS
jgi:hypothetical protein